MAVESIKIPESVMLDALNKAIDALIEKHKELGMEATGEWIRSLEPVADDNKGIILGAPYTEQLVLGREPGRRPPVAPLEEWVKAKFGITGSQAKSAAFAIATKIGNEGTTWYKQGGSDLLEILEDAKVVDNFYAEIGSYLTAVIADNLRRDLNELNV